MIIIFWNISYNSHYRWGGVKDVPWIKLKFQMFFGLEAIPVSCVCIWIESITIPPRGILYENKFINIWQKNKQMNTCLKIFISTTDLTANRGSRGGIISPMLPIWLYPLLRPRCINSRSYFLSLLVCQSLISGVIKTLLLP